MRSILLLLSSSALLGAGILASGFRGEDSAKVATQQFGPKLAKDLELVFNDPILTSASRFGFSRDPLLSRHGDVIGTIGGLHPALTPSQTNLMKLRGVVRDQGFQVEQGLFSKRLVTWTFQKPTDRTLFPEEYASFGNHSSKVSEFGKTMYKEANQRSKSFQRDGYWIYAAPIRFKHQECLACHKGAKLNDTACVVTFAFRKK